LIPKPLFRPGFYRWAAKTSRTVTDDSVLRLKFVLAAVRNWDLAERLSAADASTAFGRFLIDNPETVVNLLRPYQCAAWGPRERFKRIEQHAAVVETLGLTMQSHEKVWLADLGFVSAGASLILDRPAWLSREGDLTLSLFKDTFRAFSLSFTLADTPERTLFVGGLQGRSTDSALDLYRSLTKEFYGIRPSDLMIEMTRLFAEKAGVKKIFAVADGYRIATHRYFAGHEPHLSYDRVWEERGGRQIDQTKFQIPLEMQRRDLSEVVSKKRNMYKQRYAMLDEIKTALPANLSDAARLSFDAV